MAPVTVAQLGALFSTSACVTSGDSPSRRVLPGYTQRHGWRISGHADFGDGGSFPELDVVQMPNGLGWDTKRFPNVTPLAALDCGFGELQAKAARCALRLDPARANAPRRGTPEYDTFVLFLRDTLEDFFSANQSPSPDAFADALVRRFMAKHPNAREGRRVRNFRGNLSRLTRGYGRARRGHRRRQGLDFVQKLDHAWRFEKRTPRASTGDV